MYVMDANVGNHRDHLNSITSLELFKFSKGHKVNPAVVIVQYGSKEQL